MLNIKKTLTKILQNTSANIRGTAVTLDSYTSDYYTFPADGYLAATCGASANAQASASLRDANGTAITELGGVSNGTWATWAVFVRKGMKVKVSGLANNGHIFYYPLGGVIRQLLSKFATLFNREGVAVC